jgi:hypothetical protein
MLFEPFVKVLYDIIFYIEFTLSIINIANQDQEIIG